MSVTHPLPDLLGYSPRLTSHICEIEPQMWDALVEQQICPSHALLESLEQTGCVGGRTGWHPRHLTLWREGTLEAAMPLYEKHHSFGEYVFDWAWAQAYHQHGLRYYPKWLSAVPFTPVSGPRLLARDATARQALIMAAQQLARTSGLSSMHILLPHAEQAEQLKAAGFMLRQGIQFQWQNRGFGCFQDFLASLTRKKRKNIRQERRRVNDSGLHFVWLDGHTAHSADWTFFYHCYTNTYAQHGAMPYLTPAFFTRLARLRPAGVRLLMALRDERPIACAFFLQDEHALYGRYWGALEHIPMLHFELCYYQAIEYCIAHGIQRFEGGAQGEHKLSRGLSPTPIHSAHWLRDAAFSEALERFLAQESGGLDLYLDELDEHSPFRHKPDAP